MTFGGKDELPIELVLTIIEPLRKHGDYVSTDGIGDDIVVSYYNKARESWVLPETPVEPDWADEIYKIDQAAHSAHAIDFLVQHHKDQKSAPQS